MSRDWTFEEFCVVFGNLDLPNGELAAKVNRDPDVIVAAREAIKFVNDGKATDFFPGHEWMEFVKRASRGECGT